MNEFCREQLNRWEWRRALLNVLFPEREQRIFAFLKNTRDCGKGALAVYGFEDARYERRCHSVFRARNRAYRLLYGVKPYRKFLYREPATREFCYFPSS